MVISWLGEAAIRLQTNDLSLVIDPPSASTGMKPGRINADVVCLTQDDGRDMSAVNGKPRLLETPGEYEIKQVFIYGLHLPSTAGQVHWRIEAEEMSLGHVADLTRPLDNGELAQLEGVDILFVPVGGKSVLSPEHAANLISQIEPRIVVPMQFHLPGSKQGYQPIDAFLKEFGVKKSEPLPKLKIAKKDLPAEETQVTVLHVA